MRNDPDNEKKGEVLWRAKYDEHPDFKQQYQSDSSSDGFSSDGFRPSRRKLQMKWKMETKATIKSVKFAAGGCTARRRWTFWEALC